MAVLGEWVNPKIMAVMIADFCFDYYPTVYSHTSSDAGEIPSSTTSAQLTDHLGYSDVIKWIEVHKDLNVA